MELRVEYVYDWYIPVGQKKLLFKSDSNGSYLMRQEQRSIATKTNELQQDLNEHNIVIETLNGVDGDRKCFRYRSS